MDIDPREIVLDEAEGVLSSALRAPYPEGLETIEILSLWQEMRRFSAPPAINWGRTMARLERLSIESHEAGIILPTLLKEISFEEWRAGHESLLARLEKAEREAAPRGLDEEALRLFRLADRWRLALYGAIRAGEDDDALFDLLMEVEEGVDAALAGDPHAYRGVAPYADLVLDLVRDELEEEDPGLYSTLTPHVLINLGD